MFTENENNLDKKPVLIKFVGDVNDTNLYGPETVAKLKVGATVSSGRPGCRRPEFTVTEVTEEEGAIIARVESKRAGRI